MRILLFRGNKRDEEKQLNDYQDGRAVERILRFWTFVEKEDTVRNLLAVEKIRWPTYHDICVVCSVGEAVCSSLGVQAEAEVPEDQVSVIVSCHQSVWNEIFSLDLKQSANNTPVVSFSCGRSVNPFFTNSAIQVNVPLILYPIVHNVQCMFSFAHLLIKA
jgi:hypothetical protein